jgi:hypothetical protein
MAKVIPAIIQNSFYFGLGFLVIIAAIFLYLILSTIAFFLRLGFCLLAILCFIPLVIPTAILYQVQSEIQSFDLIIGIEKGDATGQCMGAFACTGIMMLLTIFMSIFI